MVGGPDGIAQHPHGARGPRVSESGGEAGDGAGPREAQRGGVDRGPDGSGWSAVEVADARAGGRRADQDRTRSAASVHCFVAADWCPYRGTPGSSLGACAPGRSARRGAAGPAASGGLAIGARGWGHEDQEVASHPRIASPLCRGAPEATGTAAGRPPRRWRGLAGHRARVHDQRWVRRWMRRTYGATFAARWRWCPGLDPAEWTPRELRHSFVSVLSDSGLPVEEISQARRTQRYERYRARLSASAATGDPDRRDGDGSALWPPE